MVDTLDVVKLTSAQLVSMFKHEVLRDACVSEEETPRCLKLEAELLRRLEVEGGTIE